MSAQKIIECLGKSLGPAKSLELIVEACTDYLKVAEQERTKRQEISRWEKTAIANIRAQRDLFMGYLDRSFDERAENFRQMFDVVDRAIATGNNQQLAITLDSIVSLAQASPFKELANLNSVKEALNDPNREWQF